MGLIWYMSSQPVSRLDFGFRVGDKVLHFLAYGVLALFIWWAVAGRRRPGFTAFWVSSLYGGVDELHQLWGAAGRFCDVWDWLADVSGAGVMVLLLHSWERHVHGPGEKSGVEALKVQGMDSEVPSEIDCQFSGED